MPRRADHILTVAQMRAAEEELMAAGTSVHELMQRAGHGAADYVWRTAAQRSITVLCGPGNNGGDGYVIAEAIRERGGMVRVIAAADPATDAARTARKLYRGKVLLPHDAPGGDVFVDCLFGSGLTRPLSDPHVVLLRDLAASHHHVVAVDVPSGVQSNTGAALNCGLPAYDLTIALGAWKFAHFLMPAAAGMGALRLVEIGVEPVAGAAIALGRPRLGSPAVDSHKYRRGLLGVVGGEMPGASVLAATAAQGAGAGYVKLLSADAVPGVPPDMVCDGRALSEALVDARYAALLVGPGLGRSTTSRERLAAALAADRMMVIDADGLILLGARQLEERSAPLIATPHEGEMQVLETTFGLDGMGSKVDRALALARASGMVVVAKGPDSVVAAPDGRIAVAHRASPWLSVAGTGDVLAGAVASRLATGAEPFAAACEGLWLHGEAARITHAPFTATALAKALPRAYCAAL